MLDKIRDKNRPIGLPAEDPHIFELVDMLSFCKAHKEIYIYGAEYKQRMLYKLLKKNEKINLKGFVVSSKCWYESDNDVYDIKEVCENKDAGIILGLCDRYYRDVIPKLRKAGLEYFAPSEWNKRTIAEQMTPRDPEYNSFEVSLTDHCNMSCQMCDHYAQLSDAWFIDKNVLAKDLKRMNELCGGKCAVITLLGGEPLLHPEVEDCLRITRESFPKVPIVLLTNGILLLKKDEVWKACKEYNIIISITRYPIKLDYEAIKKLGEKNNVTVLISSDIHSAVPLEEAKISYKHTFTLEANKENIFFPACHYYNHLGVVKNGRYYMCPVSAHIDIFNKFFNKNLEITAKDYIDIYKVDSWKDIAEFQADRVPFCCYCDIEHWGCHSVWKPSKNTIEEYT